MTAIARRTNDTNSVHIGNKQRVHPLSVARAVWKRKVMIIIAWLSISAAGIAIVYRWPPTYSADALVMVESQRIPETYVTATVQADLQERLDKIKQQVLSYDRLHKMIEKFDLYRKQRATHVDQEIAEMMRADVSLTLEKGWSTERPAAFRVSYQAPTPKLAAQVANQIGHFFIDENLRAREVQAVGTSEFLESRLAESRKALLAQEERLRQYKLSFNGELPEQENALLAAMSQGKAELIGIQDGLNRAHQNKLMLENALAAATTALKDREELAVKAREERAAAAVKQAEEANQLAAAAYPQQRVERLRAELKTARARYSEKHPDVQAALAELGRAEAEAKAAVNSISRHVQPVASDDPHIGEALIGERERIAGLRSQLLSLATETASLEMQRSRLLSELGSLQARIARLPVREQQLITVTRDYEISKASYQSMLDKKLASDVAANMEKQQKAEKFVMLEEAREPEKPVRPKRALLSALSVLFGLALSVALACGLEFKNGQLFGEWELPPGTAILARIPHIDPVI